MKRRACIIGAGPNGLAAAIELAQAGLQVDVFEAEPIAGGAVRTLELTLPGFRHDFGSAVYPLGAGSPFFTSLPLSEHGLEWIHSPAPVAHPLDDGTAVLLERDLIQAKSSLGGDGKSWSELVQPFVEHWWEFASDVLRPVSLVPKHPLLIARFGTNALRSARTIAGRFRGERTRALFAGLAAHSTLGLDEVLSGAFGMLMAIPAHAVGWPIPLGGAQSLTNALCGYLAKLGGKISTSSRLERIEQLSDYDLQMFDVTPRQLLALAGERFTPSFKRQLRRFRYGPGVFKVDYALSSPIPWRAPDCFRAATVHI
jgi:phytoene dehydrogenase-like protein